MDSGQQDKPSSVEKVFQDFNGRRAGLIKALTTDVKEFYRQCNPEKVNLCLYGFPNEEWEVNLPPEEVPPELPEPVLGINFARDGLQIQDWLALAAAHSDAWLQSLAYYYGTSFGFDKADRKCLFIMIHDLPTIFEVVTGSADEQAKENSSDHNCSKSKSGSMEGGSESTKYSKQAMNEDGELEEDVEKHEETLCDTCGKNYIAGEFWICCDVCDKWYHGKCVKITPSRAKHIEHYKCLSCSRRRESKGYIT